MEGFTGNQVYFKVLWFRAKAKGFWGVNVAVEKKGNKNKNPTKITQQQHPVPNS